MLGGLRELHRRIPRMYSRTAACYLQKKDFARAGEALDDGPRLDPDNHWLRVDRGMLYTLSGKREEALDELQDLMKDEDEARRLNAQVWIRTALGDLDEAFEALMREAELHCWDGMIK